MAIDRPTLRALGFCGIDDTVAPELLAAISSRYPFIEWGILLRPEMDGNARFASEAYIAKLKKLNAGRIMRLAGHLCSTRCEEVLNGDATYIAMLHNEVGVGRFQINATAANNVNVPISPTVVDNVRRVMASLPSAEFILQRNSETQPLWAALEEGGLPPNASFLFDESKGRGVIAASWPPPPPNAKFGYAGGLGPATLAAQLPLMRAAISSSKSEDGRQSASFWVDMESSLRTVLADGTDIFDVNKCMACVLVCLEEPGFVPGGMGGAVL